MNVGIVNNQLLKSTMTELTKREISVCKLIGEGLTSEQIGDKLCLSKRTIDSYSSRISVKLDVSNVVSLVIKCIRLGHIDVGNRI